MKKTTLLLGALSALTLLGGCAQIPPDAGQNPEDPYERFNRHMYVFNDGMDRMILKPVTEGYRYVVPEMARDGVSNVFSNLGEPGTAVNQVLQGKFSDGLETVFRFLVNTTFGVAGIFDVAGRIGMERQSEDFGQTLAVWGVPEGPYLMLPFLGPSNARDIWQWPVAVATNPMTYVLWDEEWYWDFGYGAAAAVNARSVMMDSGMEDMRGNVLDEYVAVRSAYTQMRRSAVSDGAENSAEVLEGLTPLSFEDEE